MHIKTDLTNDLLAIINSFLAKLCKIQRKGTHCFLTWHLYSTTVPAGLTFSTARIVHPSITSFCSGTGSSPGKYEAGGTKYSPPVGATRAMESPACMV